LSGSLGELKVLPHPLTLSLLVVAKVKIQENAQLHFVQIPQNKQYHAKVLPKRFHLNGYTIRFHPQTQKVRLHYMTPLLILGVKELNHWLGFTQT